MTLHGLMAFRGLTREQLDSIFTLMKEVEGHDMLELKMHKSMLPSRPTDETNDFLYYHNGRLVGYLGLFVLQPSEGEISGMVDPAFRRTGIFHRLMEAAVREARSRGIPRLLLICPRSSLTGQTFIKALGKPYSFSEYVMELRKIPGPPPNSGVTLREATAGDEDLLTELNIRGFEMTEEDARHYVRSTLHNQAERTLIGEHGDTAVGKMGFMPSEGGAFLYGFCVLPEYRGRGVGRSMLRQTIDYVRADGLHNVRLEVACDNENALMLYETCGFVKTTANDYYEWLL